MTILTYEELAMIQAAIDEKIEQAAALGLTMHVDDDLREWKKHTLNAPGTGGVSRTLDPDLNDIRPGNSFWINLQDPDGRIVMCQANRFVETEDFVHEFVCTHRLFGDRFPTLHHFPVELCDPVPILRGRMSFGAGNWVHPDYRGKGLGGFASRMGRMLSLRHFLIDYFVGFIEAMDRRRQYGEKALGMMNRRHLLTGRYPGRDSDLNVDIYWMHRGELMNQISRELIDSGFSPVALKARIA